MSLAVTLLAGCDALCENERAASHPSPSGKLIAVVFHRECGATTPFNTQVSIVNARASLPDGGGNVLIVEGKIEPTIRWSSDTRLSIEGAGVDSAEAFKKVASISGVEIVYAQGAPSLP